MNKKILFGIAAVIVVLVMLLLFIPDSGTEETGAFASFTPLEISVAGNSAYIIYDSNGSSTATILSLTEKPYENIYVLEKEQGLGISHLPDFIQEMSSLSEYGLNVSIVTSVSSLSEGALIIVAQGAMPESILPLLKQNFRIIYIGKTDAVISEGLISKEWYSLLSENEKSKIIFYNGTLDDIYNEGKENEIKQDIIYNVWTLESNKTYELSEGKGTIVVPFKEASYLRIIHPIQGKYKVTDSEELKKSDLSINVLSAFPSEDQSFYITIKDSLGIPTLVISKNGINVSEEKLGTVGQNVFYKQLSFAEPGDYILKIYDYENELASGIFHVSNLEVDYLGSNGLFYNFKVSIDEVPLDNEEVNIHLLDSENSMELIVYDGVLSVPAKLKKGINTFVIEIYGKEFSIDVENSEVNAWEVYFTFGPWVLLIVILIYGGVMLTKRQPYRLRFDSAVHLSSGELKTGSKRIQKIIPKAISEFGNNECINAREFSLALKKYLTDGHDVLDGNAESILKSFEKKEYLDSYQSFYKLKGKEDVKKTVMDRLIREKLIEQGIVFKYSNGIFQTKEQDITFWSHKDHPPKSKAKLILVFENHNTVSRYLERLPKNINARTALRIRNGSLLLLSINELADYL